MVSSRIAGLIESVMHERDRGPAPWSSFPALLIRVSAVMCLFVGFEAWTRQVSRLPAESYEQPVLCWELIRNVPGWPLLPLAGVVAVMFRRGSLWREWGSFDGGQSIRRFVVLVAAIMAWAFSTYDYNLYFDQGHYMDRGILVALAVLTYWRPIFILPFVVLLHAMIWQMNLPLGEFIWAVDGLPLGVLTLFAAVYFWLGATRGRRTAEYVFLVCCLIASYYWWPGVGKLRLNWISHGHVYLMTFGAYAHGWLSFVDPATLVDRVQVLAWFDWPMRIGTMILECGALFCMWRRRLFIVFVACWLGFQACIFAMIGYFFWKWMLVEIACLGFLMLRPVDAWASVFTRPAFLISILVIGGSRLWFEPAGLAWYDTRLAYTFRIGAYGESGAFYELPPQFFAPYHDEFTMNNFKELAHRAPLVGPYGVTRDAQMARTLLTMTDPDRILALETERPTSERIAHDRAVFSRFVKRFLGGWNRRRSKGPLRVLCPPAFLWSFPRGDPFNGQESLTRAVVHQHTWLYDGERMREIRREQVTTIELTPPARSVSGP